MAENPVGKQTVLVVDDVADDIMLITSVLKDAYRVKVANGGERAIEIASTPPVPDLILLDIMMPGVDGYGVCRRLKADPVTRDIPVIFLTAKSAEADEQRGFDAGCEDYITKPISPAIVRARVRAQLLLKSARDFLRNQNAFLENEVLRRTREVQAMQDATMVAMGSLAETRDNDTGNHIRRTQHYVRVLARKLQSHPRFARALDDATIELLFKSAPLHDIGKVGIPDRILLKPGKLTPEEFEVMKTHVLIGRDAIVAAERILGTPSSFLHHAREIVYSHHERWDGAGYPEGLAGEAIPLAARLMAFADVYDALINRRVYKSAFPHDKAVEIIRQGRGTQFDPDMTDAFVEVAGEFHRIAEEFADTAVRAA